MCVLSGSMFTRFMLTVFRWAGARRWIAAQVVAGVGVLVHRRERVSESAARTGKAGVLATLAAAKVLVAAAYRAIPARTHKWWLM